MFEVVRSRINYIGWPISVDGIDVENNGDEGNFTFDGVVYPSLHEAIEHYVYSFDLDASLFKQVLSIMSASKFSQAVRFCRLLVGASAKERSDALKSLT